MRKYERLLGGSGAQAVVTDPPYNGPITNHVSGLGKAKHQDFAIASGEMSRIEFTQFLAGIFRHLIELELIDRARRAIERRTSGSSGHG